jgi:hypothetical protein
MNVTFGEEQKGANSESNVYWHISFIFCVGSKCKKTVILTGSTAICLVFDDAVTIGADSKVSGITGDREKSFYYGRTCKVHQRSNLIYASVGLYGSSNMEIDFQRTIANLTFKSAKLQDRIHEIRDAS